ncbi:MAG: sigma-54-dependent Fis family transcriptional regulator [Acidobacteria bacterium]|nr:sigma-54-dependent Fis family transcriptional regulator [Acidobacteriota bacterium]MCB9396410.1 sigma-54-dependent Fis family transcriptional regulator [Acidobacteriota bacterium]
MQHSQAQLFFDQFAQHLQKIRDEGSSANPTQRAHILLGQLKVFEKAVLESVDEAGGQGLGVMAITQLANSQGLDGLFQWLLQHQQVLPVTALYYRNGLGQWSVVHGDDGWTEPSGTQWIEKNVLASFQNQQTVGCVLHFYGASRVVLHLAKNLDQVDSAVPFLRLLVRLLAPLIEPCSFAGKIKNPVRLPLIAEDPTFLKTIALLEKAATTDVSVLLEGESGSGKEVLANFIHHHSPRRTKPMVAVNCAAIPAGLMESELFGHEKGSFTGAVARQIGKVEAANGGTLFLDEIGEMELPLQAKLLRFLQLREFHRVGGRQKVHVDVRIIAASNRNLKKRVSEGQFREDLYYRLSVMPVSVPPLRERPLDIIPLAEFFLHKYASAFNLVVPKVEAPVLQRLANYSFPGNVRELENIIQNMLVVAQGKTIEQSHLPEPLRYLEPTHRVLMPRVRRFSLKAKLPVLARRKGINPSELPPQQDVPQTNEELKLARKHIQELADQKILQIEREFITELLERANGSMPQAAELAGINRTLLYKILDRTKTVSKLETKG